MRKIFTSVLVTLVAMAAGTPSFANEARVEARGGVVFGGGDEEGIAGVAAGYDFDLGDRFFIGPELSADKVLVDGTRVTFGIGGRAGVKVSERGKLYAIGTWQSKPCRGCDDYWTAGAGYQHAFGSSLYGKVEYRHFFADGGGDADAILAGVGLRF